MLRLECHLQVVVFDENRGCDRTSIDKNEETGIVHSLFLEGLYSSRLRYFFGPFVALSIYNLPALLQLELVERTCFGRHF